MNTRTGTSQNVSEALGSELVTDGGFDAVMEGAEQFTNGDAEADYPSINGVGISVARSTSALDTGQKHGGAKSVKVTSDGTASNNFYTRYLNACGLTDMLTYKTSVWVYLPSGQSGFTTIQLVDKQQGIEIVLDSTTITDEWVQLSGYFNQLHLNNDYHAGVRTNSIADPTGFFFYWDDISTVPVTLANFTAGAGWAPQATAGALTGKAQKIAGTASDLEQDVSAVTENIYRVVHTATRTAGSETAEVGGTDGAARSTAATFTDNIRAATTSNLKIGADASFAGTIDVFSCKQITRRAAPD